MARLQILELPEGANDDRAPFVLVVDETVPQRVVLGPDVAYRDYWQDVAQQIGARAVIVTPETVDIPANDLSGYNGIPGGDYSAFAATVGRVLGIDTNSVAPDVAGWLLTACSELEKSEAAREQLRQERDNVQSLNDDLRERLRLTSDAASNADTELHSHKAALTDALGVDRLRDWDDIRNAAAGLRKQRDAQAAELEQLRAGEEPGWRPDVVPTPGQWIARWNQVTPERRLSMAAQTVEGMARANDCLMLNHAAELAELRAEVARLRAGPVDA